MRVSFWKDEASRTVDATIFSTVAPKLSEKLAEECKRWKKKRNTWTQIRRFYDEVLRLDAAARNPDADWDAILPLVHMLVAKAAYAQGRELVTQNFVYFIRSSVEQVKAPKDLRVFASLFEAVMGFYRRDCPAK